jgi:hypothetical protein
MDTRPTVGRLANSTSRYGLIATVIVAIVDGSLYPFEFRYSGPLTADLLHFAGTWNQPPESRGDLLANLLLYMPLGLTVTLALGRVGSGQDAVRGLLHYGCHWRDGLSRD